MGIARRIEVPWTTVSTGSSTEEFVPATDWVSTEGATSARGWLELRGLVELLSVAMAIQTANDVRSPDAHTRVQALVTSNGVSDPDTSATSLSLDGKKFVRCGFAVKSGKAPTKSMGRVAGAVELFE